jgi:hypothetical protein
VTPEAFDALFDTFRSTVIRLETLPAYAVGGAEGERLAAFRAGLPRPLRNVVTDPWLARIARTSMEGKDWRRVRIVDDPLTDYQRYQMASYRESQATGEGVFIARRGDVPAPPTQVGDFWLFDAGTPEEHAVLMRYDEDGHWLGADDVRNPAAVAALVAESAAVIEHAVPLNVFLAGAVA